MHFTYKLKSMILRLKVQEKTYLKFPIFRVDMEQKMGVYRLSNNTNSTEYEELVNKNTQTMNQYTYVIIALVIFMVLRAITFFIYCSKASVKIHATAFKNLINACTNFFDKNLSGNIINRLSRDLSIVDENLPHVVYDCIRVSTIR